MLGNLLYRARFALLVIVLGVTAGSIYLLPKIEINQDFSHYFPNNDPDLKFYHAMTAELGDEDNLMAVAVYRQAGIFDSAFLNLFHQFVLASKELPHVERIVSITKMQDPVKTLFGFIGVPYLHLDDPSKLHFDSIRIAEDPRINKRFISDDFKTISFSLQIRSDLSAAEGEALIEELELLKDRFPFEEAHFIGRKYMEVSYNRLANKDLRIAVILALALIILVLGVLYRSFWGVMLPMLIFIVGMINFLGYLVLINRSLDAMSNLFPTILLIVSISDVVHLFSKYEDKLKLGLDKITTLKMAVNEVGVTIFLTSFTTAVGFLILATSPIPAVRQFGRDVAVGVMLTYLLTMALVPGVLFMAKRSAISLNEGIFRQWERTARRIFQFTLNNNRKIWGFSIILVIVCLAGIPKINTNNLLSGSLPSAHPLKKAFSFFETHLAGTRTFEIAITPKQGLKLNNLVILKEIEKIHIYLDSLPMIRGVLSPVTYYKSINKAFNSGDISAYELPENERVLEKQEKQIPRQLRSRFQSLINQKRSLGKISARTDDVGRQNVNALNQEIQNRINRSIDTSLVDLRLTGASMMVDKIQEHSIRNLFTGLILALLVIGALIALLFRQLKMVFITLCANIIPLVLAAGFMAMTGIELRYGSSIVFTIGFVIAVDDTIHFLSNYHMDRLRKKSVNEAILLTLQGTGRALLITTVILLLSFIILVFSHFRDSKVIGVLVSFMLLAALIADLILVPTMLKDPK